MDYTIAAFYRFTPIDDPSAFKAMAVERLQALGIFGTLLVAAEGYNGTLAGSADSIAGMLAFLAMPLDEVKFSKSPAQNFDRLKVKVKKEIITFRQADADPARHPATYVEASDWNALIARDDVLLLDTRNACETELGMFAGAIDPGITHFTHFAEYAKTLDPSKHRSIAMYCTGGVRCEKASAYMLGLGFEQVYHLKGGILRYLETVPEAETRWRGECFVFDQRVVVTGSDFTKDAS
jgi:UPF0176 protein